MNEGLIPSRYAKALYKFACERDAAAGVYRLMGNITAAYAANPQLGVAVANPFVADADKMSLLTTAAGLPDAKDVKAADAKTDVKATDREVFADFLKLLKENKRLEMAGAIARAYGDIYRRENKIYRVRIVSAQELDAPERERLQKLIGKHLPDGKMEYTFATDPDLIGGFTVDVENERLDASVKNELKQLRLKLLRQA